MSFYNHKTQFENNLKRIKESGELIKENKDIILKFKDYLLSEGLSVQRINRYISDLFKYNKILNKPFDKATKEDLRKVIADLNQTEYADETKKCFKIILRKLYRFIRGVEEKGVYPDEVKWISIAIPSNHKKLPEELLTEDEVKRIIEKCDNLRDKTLISCLYESGCRVGEIGTMKIKHVSFEQYGARLTVNGKTGMRKILIVNSTPYLQEWINRHPYNDKENYLWISNNGKSLSYTRIVAILKNASRRAGIKKKVHPHILRHSRATLLASTPGMSDASMKHYFGWTQGSKMAATYIHMSGMDTDKAILMANGIETNSEKIKSKLEPKKCLKCKNLNEFTNRFCKICGFVLDKEEAEKIMEDDFKRKQADNIMERIIDDPEFKELLIRKIKSQSLKLS